MALTPKQLQAVALFSLDETASLKTVAERLGVDPRTVSDWKAKPEFQAAMRLSPDHQVQTALLLKAISGDTNAIDKWIRHYGEKPEARDTFADALHLTPDDLARIERDVIASVGGRQAVPTDESPVPVRKRGRPARRSHKRRETVLMTE